jgi:DNA-binding NtrC family response regulator
MMPSRIDMDPPLRERKEGIQPLTDHFLRMFAVEMGRDAPDLSDAVRQRLLGYDYPGNIRELKNLIERALINSRGDEILPEHVQFLDEPQAASPSAPVAEPARPTDGLPEVTLAEAENVLIRDVLTRTGGNIAAAARLLGTNRPRIYRFLEQESGRKPD